MAAALRVQNIGSQNGGTTATAQLTGVQAGDLLVCCVRERDGSAAPTVSDDVNAGNWTQGPRRNLTAAQIVIFYKLNSSAGNPTVSVVFGGASVFDCNVSAWSGVVTSSALDTSNTAGNSGVTSHNHGSVTPSAASLLITALGSTDHGGISSLDTGFTALNRATGTNMDNRQIYAYKVAHTGAINPAHVTTSTVSSDGAVAAFLEIAGGNTDIVPGLGGVPVTGRVMTLGRYNSAGVVIRRA